MIFIGLNSKQTFLSMISILESFRNILTCNLRMFWKRGKKMKKGKKGLKFEFKKLEGKKI